jgi:TRAP-type C4-dicarboxylate transport system permease small subunit
MKLEQTVRRLETAVISSLVLAAIALYLYGSATRVLAPALTPDWGEEVTIYLVLWSTLLTGRRLTSERGHISAQVIEHLLPPRFKRWLDAAVGWLTFGFCAVMLWLGVEATRFVHGLDERSATTLQMPQAWAVDVALPIAMASILVALLLPSRRG